MESRSWLPQNSWAILEQLIRRLGEGRGKQTKARENDVHFLEQIGFVDTPDELRLTQRGREYFDHRFVRNEGEAAREVLALSLLDFKPVQLIVQLLWGVRNVSKDNVEALLRSRNITQGVSPRAVGTFLGLLESAGVVSYNRRLRQITVLVEPSKKGIPANVFISPETPFSNIMWLRRILGECTNHIFWLDKHFYKIGLDHIWETADGTRIQEIRILSLELKDNLTKAAREEYERLCKELSRKGISLEWRIIDSSKIRDTHDRWIIAANGAWNVPNVNAIHSGQRSELNRSTNRDEVETAFLGYWNQASPI